MSSFVVTVAIIYQADFTNNNIQLDTNIEDVIVITHSNTSV